MRKLVYQECTICGVRGVFSARAIVALGEIPRGTGLVGQCPHCLAFVCSGHSQLAVCHVESDDLSELGATILETGFVPVVLCCPFHQIPLERSAGEYRLLVARQRSASVEHKDYAREYTTNPALYTRRTRGFDFSMRRFAREDATDWPPLEPKQSKMLDALKAAFATFDAGSEPVPPVQSDIREIRVAASDRDQVHDPGTGSP